MCHQMASLAFRLYKLRFRPGFRPGPRWGAYGTSRLPSRLGKAISPTHSIPCRRLRFGVSLSTTLTSSFGLQHLSSQLLNRVTLTFDRLIPGQCMPIDCRTLLCVPSLVLIAQAFFPFTARTHTFKQTDTHTHSHRRHCSSSYPTHRYAGAG